MQVRFFYSFTCQDNLYLVMEYLNGGDLYSLLRKVGCLEEDVARIYLAELVRRKTLELYSLNWLLIDYSLMALVNATGSCFGISSFSWNCTPRSET